MVRIPDLKRNNRIALFRLGQPNALEAEIAGLS